MQELICWFLQETLVPKSIEGLILGSTSWMINMFVFAVEWITSVLLNDCNTFFVVAAGDGGWGHYWCISTTDRRRLFLSGMHTLGRTSTPLFSCCIFFSVFNPSPLLCLYKCQALHNTKENRGFWFGAKS